MILRFFFRLGHTGKFAIEPLLGIDTDKVEVIRPIRSEDRLHQVSLVLAEQTMIDKDTGQVLADGFGKQDRGDRGVHPA